MKKLILIMACMALVACSTTKQGTVPLTGNVPAVDYRLPVADENGDPVTLGGSITGTKATESAAAQLAVFSFSESVYFDYDKHTIKPEYIGKIEEYARYIQVHGLSVALLGNADDHATE